MRDSYQRFFSQGLITKDQFFEFGLSETIYAPQDKAEHEWQKLKHRIQNNQPVHIRGFGRNSNGTHLFQDFYKEVFGNEHVAVDPTNNAIPTKIIRDLTGYSKSPSARHEAIRNYQISHIFGRTKNVYTFTAPWNMVYLPKIIDPFTGHEAKGDMVDEYQAIFQQRSYARFEPLIEDYNKLITQPELTDRIAAYLDKLSSNAEDVKTVDKFTKALRDELSPIIMQSPK
ncbi:hypothetical protein O1B68_002153 [Vibrio cholerae]|nr:hypothetical protein [Vibrio cholerae]